MFTCVLTGQSYKTLAEAAKAVGVSLPTAARSVREGRAITHRTYDHPTWLVGPSTPSLQPPQDNRTKSIKCVTTDTIFPTMSDAVEEYDLNLTALSRALRLDRPIYSKKLDRQLYFMKE